MKRLLAHLLALWLDGAAASYVFESTLLCSAAEQELLKQHVEQLKEVARA